MTDTSLIARNDTFLGICEAIGEDFHFNANILRVALGVIVLWNPLAMVGIYLALGIVVAGSRWAFPSPRSDQSTTSALPQADNDTAAVPTALAG